MIFVIHICISVLIICFQQTFFVSPDRLPSISKHYLNILSYFVSLYWCDKWQREAKLNLLHSLDFFLLFLYRIFDLNRDLTLAKYFLDLKLVIYFKRLICDPWFFICNTWCKELLFIFEISSLMFYPLVLYLLVMVQFVTFLYWKIFYPVDVLSFGPNWC